MACIASSFTGSVAALKASKVQVSIAHEHDARRRSAEMPVCERLSFFRRKIARHSFARRRVGWDVSRDGTARIDENVRRSLGFSSLGASHPSSPRRGPFSVIVPD